MACRTAVEGCLDEPEALPGEAPSSASSIAGAVGGTTTGEQRTLLILANDAGFPRSTLTTEAALARIGGP